jgi:hypothetical protein
LYEREIVGSEFVVARGHTAAMLDFVEDPLDQIPGSIEARAEADRLGAIAAR